MPNPPIAEEVQALAEHQIEILKRRFPNYKYTLYVGPARDGSSSSGYSVSVEKIVPDIISGGEKIVPDIISGGSIFRHFHLMGHLGAPLRWPTSL